jgi:hypothetical protein
LRDPDRGGDYPWGSVGTERDMYIGIGTLVLILVILLIVFLARRV